MKIMLSMPSTISSTVSDTRAIQASGLVIDSMTAIMHMRVVTAWRALSRTPDGAASRQAPFQLLSVDVAPQEHPEQQRSEEQRVAPYHSGRMRDPEAHAQQPLQGAHLARRSDPLTYDGGQQFGPWRPGRRVEVGCEEVPRGLGPGLLDAQSLEDRVDAVERLQLQQGVEDGVEALDEPWEEQHHDDAQHTGLDEEHQQERQDHRRQQEQPLQQE